MKKIIMKWILLTLFLFLQANLSITVFGQQVLHGHIPPDITKFGLKPISRLDSTQQLHFDITLPLRNQAELTNLLQQIYDPTNPNYRHYLSVEQFTSEFGPTAADYQSVITFAKANGLTVTDTSPNNLVLELSGTVTNVEKAFNVKMQVYKHPTEDRTFFAPDAEPSLNLTTSILNIGRLNTYYRTRPHAGRSHIAKVQNIETGTGPFWGYDFRAAYAPNVSLTGSGQVVGLVAFDGFAQSDITYYENYRTPNLPNVTITPILLGGFNGQPVHQSWQEEVSLDIEMAISMAPGLSQVRVYEGRPDSVLYSSAWHTLLNRMATDNIAKQLSCSWYIPGGSSDSATEQIFLEMAAQGQSFFNASGDDDAYTGLIDYPGDSPNITQVGGTTLTTSGTGGSYQSETVWNWGIEYNIDGIGSGGGISTQYSLPSWQQNVSMSNNQGSTTMRNIPDVALTADHCYYRSHNVDFTNDGGTSFAAPLWAGFTALANQQLSANGQYVGLINPSIYQIGKNQSLYANCFHDVTTGDNKWSQSPNKFSAVTSFDLCTGWGTPNGQNLINALTAAIWSGNITINSNFTIPSGVTVTVLPGTTVQFTNGAQLIVNGTLIADGSSKSTPILFNFTSPNSSTQNGIVFNSGSSGTINYCQIRNAYRGIYENNKTVNITNSAISGCTDGIYLYYSSPLIQGCNIYNNSNAGVNLLYSTSSTVIKEDSIHDNYDGLYCSSYSQPTIGNSSTQHGNNIINNDAGIICFNSANPMIGNSTTAGYNNLVNTSYNVVNTTGNTAYAYHNWWGTTNPTNFKITSGNVLYTSYLSAFQTGIPHPPLSKISGNLATTVNGDIPMLAELDNAYELTASNNLAQARTVCLNLINNYPDYSVSYNALNLLQETYLDNELSSKKDVYNSIFNNKVKKDLYATAGLILANIDKENKLKHIDDVINNYTSQAVVELALFDKFVFYYFEKQDRDNALTISKELDALFPLSRGAIEAHKILGDMEYYKIQVDNEKATQKTTSQTPTEFALLGNYPNPFNPTTRISYQLPKNGFVTLKVYDILGREVASLVNENQQAGNYSIPFDASKLSSGIYIYTIRANDFIQSKKMNLVK